MIMTDKVRKGNIEFSQEFNKNFNIYQEKSKRKSSLINEQLKKQNDLIFDKLKQRRDRSISKSINNSFFGKRRISGKSQICEKKNLYSEKKQNWREGEWRVKMGVLKHKDFEKNEILEELRKFEQKKGEIQIDESLGINFDVSFG